MTEPNKNNRVLREFIGRAHNLAESIDYSADSIVSKTLLDKPPGTITLFAFDAGQKLSEHTTQYDAVVQVLDGSARLTIGGKNVLVSSGQAVIMPANVPHAVTAEEKFKMLLTMIRT